jgi:hypothetical protein
MLADACCAKPTPGLRRRKMTRTTKQETAEHTENHRVNKRKLERTKPSQRRF